MSYSNYAASDFSAYPREVRGSGPITASRTLGYVGLLAWLLPVVGFPVTLIGFVLGILSLWGAEPGKALRATLLCAFGLLLTAANSYAGYYMYTHGKFAKATPPQAQQMVNPHCESPASTSPTATSTPSTTRP
jgi:hypothetical protein